MLKNKIKKLKLDYGDTISTTTYNQTEFAAPKSHATKNLENIGTNRAKEIEKLKEELVETRDILESLQQKYKGACSRKSAVENEMKELKTLMASKVKILLDKTENDDKLINALRSENARIKASKGIKAPASSKTGDEEAYEMIYKLKQENNKYKNDLAVTKAELQKKEERVNELTMNCIGAPDEHMEEKENIIIDLEERVEQLERENFMIRNQKPEAAQRVSKTENEKIIKDLSKDNARLRSKVADLSEKVTELQNEAA